MTRTVERDIISLDDFAAERRWVAWREETRKRADGSTHKTKIPHDPNHNGQARIPTDPSTWGTRKEAEAAWRKYLDDGRPGGIGIVLGELEDGQLLMGIDLDGCVDPETKKIKSWAVEVLDRFDTYAEVSPSNKGIKAFYRVAAEDVDEVNGLLERKTRKTFSVDTHREIAIDRGRYYAVTDQWLEDWPETLRTVSVADVRWFFEEAGPRFLQEHGVKTGKRSARQNDMSFSGYGFDFMHERKAAGDTFEQACEAIRADQGKAGDWARNADERQLQRAWDNNSVNTLHSWDDPDPSLLDDRRGKLPKFPLEALASEKMRDWAERAAIDSGTTVEHVIVPFLGVASGLIGASRLVRPVRSWIEPMTCWTALVGYSGSRKTPGINMSRRALDMVEDGQAQTIAERQHEHTQKVALAKVARRTWEEAAKKASKAGQRPPPMPPEAAYQDIFITPRLYVTDATVESLALQLQARPQGIIMIVEELARLFSNMSRYQQGSDSEFWLEAHDGNPYHQTRIGRPPIDIPHLLIGLIGGIQPDKLTTCFKGPADGMYARVLFGWPDQPPYRKLVDHYTNDADQLANVLEKLAYLGDNPHHKYVALTEQARKEFDRLNYTVDKYMNTYFGRELEWWSKIPKHALRLAGTLAYLWWAFEKDEGDPEPKIGVGDIENTVKIVRDFFWPHARSCLRQIGIDDRHADARRLLQWLIATNKEVIGREEVRRGPLGRRLNADTTQAILQYLQKAGWLRAHSEQTGGRPKLRWEVNPKLLRK